jgi:hypothetical protein
MVSVPEYQRSPTSFQEREEDVVDQAAWGQRDGGASEALFETHRNRWRRRVR